MDREISRAKMEGISLSDRIMSSLGICETDACRICSGYFAMDFIADCENTIDVELFRELPPELLKEGRCLPLDMNQGLIRIAVADPFDLDIVPRIEQSTGCTVVCSLTTPSELARLQKKYFESDTIFRQYTGKIAREYEQNLPVGESMSIEEMRKRTESEPVVKMVILIFDEAIKLGASDIHLEPAENHATVRFRIDGLLRQHTEVTKWMFSPLTSRIKILADLDIAEKRSPQDGRIRYTYENQQYDFRVSTLPTHFGEKTVIRILKHDHSLLDLANIGLSPACLESLAELIEKPQGMIFVTGPTGSGKSSTLFACLNRICHKAINITTIENPIEYKLEGINQVQINEKAGVTFSSALRSILRQDPDVILVGEIRDQETAQIAVQAAQTGHLVLSTLHTNDAVSAITRMRDLGVPPFLIASSILAVIAQRLVRIICPACKQPLEMTDSIRKRWNALTGAGPLSQAFEGRGCPECNQTGFKGRVGIFELVVISDKLRDLISENSSETMIRRVLRENGFTTIILDGIEKVSKGITSPDELLRIVQVDDMR